MKNPFLKYVMKEKKENIFHSSAYGKAQNAEAIGAASVESFEERMKVDKNRQIVKGYNDSRIVNGMYANGPRAKQYVPPEKKDMSADRNMAPDRRNASRDGVAASSAKPAVPSTKPAAPPAKRVFAPIKPNFGK